VATTAGYTAHTAPASANALTTSADVTTPENVSAPAKAPEPEHVQAASTSDHGWLL
jgi:hypothetical protein